MPVNVCFGTITSGCGHDAARAGFAARQMMKLHARPGRVFGAVELTKPDARGLVRVHLHYTDPISSPAKCRN